MSRRPTDARTESVSTLITTATPVWCSKLDCMRVAIVAQLSYAAVARRPDDPPCPCRYLGVSTSMPEEIDMAKNTGKGSRVGSVSERTQVQNPVTGEWVKRDDSEDGKGRFMDVKEDGEKFKGVATEPDGRRTPNK